MVRSASVTLALVGLSVLASTALCGDGTPQRNSYTIEDVREFNHLRTLGTDFRCVNDCTSKGYQYALCQSKCSYPDPIVARPPTNYAGIHGTDFQCVGNCTRNGYQYQLCLNRCSY